MVDKQSDDSHGNPGYSGLYGVRIGTDYSKVRKRFQNGECHGETIEKRDRVSEVANRLSKR